jgi:tRNA (guanine37-N1)-methyltransferase
VRIDIVSIFPDYLKPLELSLIGRARMAGLLTVHVHDLRAWTQDRHHTVDDTPYGGGPGMVMRPEPWGAALDELLTEAPDESELVVPSPAGTPFTQTFATRLAGCRRLVFACGRYEGIDQRVVDHYAEAVPVHEVSIGDYVLNGGEVAAMVIIEAVARLVPGVLGNPSSLDEESHAGGPAGGLLEYPVYTKPPRWRGRDVPEVLLSGHHGQIARWRRDQSLRRTAARRPDLLARAEPGLSAADRAALEI